jgi:preprotein translocase subunit SecG
MQITTLFGSLTLLFAVLLVILVLLQRPQTDSAGAFSSEAGTNTHTRRGGEKTVFQATILIAILFVASSVATLLFR